MSMHRSLKQPQFKLKRNVRKRHERLEKLIRTNKFVDGLTVFGMPKEKIVHIKLKLKEEKEEVVQDLGLKMFEELKKDNNKKKKGKR